MYSVDVSEQHIPVECEMFKIVPKNKYPLCMLGYEIKNLFDQKYCTISKKYKPKDIVQLTKLPTTTPVFLRGVTFTPNIYFLNLIEKLTDYRNASFNTITRNTYSKILHTNNLSCKYSLNSLHDGVYPFDSECLSKLTRDKNILGSLYEDMMRDTCVPSYLKLKYYKIFLLLDTKVSV